MQIHEQFSRRSAKITTQLKDNTREITKPKKWKLSKPMAQFLTSTSWTFRSNKRIRNEDASKIDKLKRFLGFGEQNWCIWRKRETQREREREKWNKLRLKARRFEIRKKGSSSTLLSSLGICAVQDLPNSLMPFSLHCTLTSLSSFLLNFFFFKFLYYTFLFLWIFSLLHISELRQFPTRQGGSPARFRALAREVKKKKNMRERERVWTCLGCE